MRVILFSCFFLLKCMCALMHVCMFCFVFSVRGHLHLIIITLITLITLREFAVQVSDMHTVLAGLVTDVTRAEHALTRAEHALMTAASTIRAVDSSTSSSSTSSSRSSSSASTSISASSSSSSPVMSVSHVSSTELTPSPSLGAPSSSHPMDPYVPTLDPSGSPYGLPMAPPAWGRYGLLEWSRTWSIRVYQWWVVPAYQWCVGLPVSIRVYKWSPKDVRDFVSGVPVGMAVFWLSRLLGP
jgi:hypothetical protein